jgi:hypothetical protein
VVAQERSNRWACFAAPTQIAECDDPLGGAFLGESAIREEACMLVEDGNGTHRIA